MKVVDDKNAHILSNADFSQHLAIIDNIVLGLGDYLASERNQWEDWRIKPYL